jgi:hypothetical protein
VPAWEEFNWGSRGPHYRVGGVIVAHFFWENTIQVNLYGHDESNDMLLNVFHVLAPGPVAASDCDAVAGAVGGWCTSTYSTTWALNISSDRVVATDVSVLDSFQSEIAANASGGLLGAAVPSNVTLAVKKSTGLRGRANRGDWYTWPCTVDQLESLDSNLFLASHRDACVAALENLIAALNTAGYALVVASEATGLTHVVKHFVATDRAVDSQRRRLRGRGR